MSRRRGSESPEQLEQEVFEPSLVDEQAPDGSHARQAKRLRLLWDYRRFFLRASVLGLMVSTLTAFVIPGEFTSRTRLMPPDPQSASGAAMMAAFAAKSSSGLGSVAADLLGVRTTGALFVGVLRSETTQDRLVQQFELNKVYGSRLVTDAISRLDENTSISEERKSGIITITVTDRSPKRAAALANAYIDQLNALVVELSTSSAHRERQFLEDRLKLSKQDLDDASNQLAQFSSTNSTLDIQQEGKAMLDAAANLNAQMIAAQSQLEGLRQIYTDNNPRVQSLSARVADLRRELGKLSGAKGQSTLVPDQNQPSNMLYPSIRNLPLLGVKYAEYYRKSKVEETVYQLLTEQYELAKVEEAKETPSVKVLDRARVPEKQSFPPRLSIVFLGTFFAMGMSVACMFVARCWQEADSHDPRKILADEVVAELKAHTHWASQNGDSSRARRFWNRLARRPRGNTSMDHSNRL